MSTQIQGFICSPRVLGGTFTPPQEDLTAKANVTLTWTSEGVRVFCEKVCKMDMNSKYVSGNAKYSGTCEYISKINTDYECTKRAFFNLPGETRGAFCSEHSDKETMVNVWIDKRVRKTRPS